MNSRTDEEDDLQLRIRRESIPLVRRAAGGSNVVKGDLAGQLPREMGLRGAQARGYWGRASEDTKAGKSWKRVLELSLHSTTARAVGNG